MSIVLHDRGVRAPFRKFARFGDARMADDDDDEEEDWELLNQQEDRVVGVEIAMQNDNVQHQISALKSAFEVFDEDGSGTLDAEELRKILTRIGGDGSEKDSAALSEDDASEILKELDVNGDGVIDVKEVTLAHPCPALPSAVTTTAMPSTLPSPRVRACYPQFIRKFLPEPAVPSPSEKCLHCNFASWAGCQHVGGLMSHYQFCSRSCEDAGQGNAKETANGFHQYDVKSGISGGGERPVASDPENKACIAVYPKGYEKPPQERKGYEKHLEEFKQLAPDGKLDKEAVRSHISPAARVARPCPRPPQAKHPPRRTCVSHARSERACTRARACAANDHTLACHHTLATGEEDVWAAHP